MPPKPRQVRIESKSAMAAMQQLEQRSDEELLKETRYKSAAQGGATQSWQGGATQP